MFERLPSLFEIRLTVAVKLGKTLRVFLNVGKVTAVQRTDRTVGFGIFFGETANITLSPLVHFRRENKSAPLFYISSASCQRPLSRSSPFL